MEQRRRNQINTCNRCNITHKIFNRTGHDRCLRWYPDPDRSGLICNFCYMLDMVERHNKRDQCKVELRIKNFKINTSPNGLNYVGCYYRSEELEHVHADKIKSVKLVIELDKTKVEEISPRQQ